MYKNHVRDVQEKPDVQYKKLDTRHGQSSPSWYLQHDLSHKSNATTRYQLHCTMNKSSSTAYCTDITWLGRAHCGKCHIRHLMLFSELPETAFDSLLQPVDHFLYPPGATLYSADTQKKHIYSIRRGMVKLVHVSRGWHAAYRAPARPGCCHRA